MTAKPTAADKLPPWMEPLSPESREAVRRNVEQAPPLTARQRERLRLLFRSTASESAGAA